MKRFLPGLKPALRLLIRSGYILLLLGLAGYAAFTYWQLDTLRKRPVALPNYAFYVVDKPEKASVVQVIGSWIIDSGTAGQRAVQTTSLECKRLKSLCVESTAVITLEGGGYLETVPLIHEIEQLTDTEIITRPLKGRCTERVILVDIANRKTSMTSVATQEPCTELSGKFTLGSGATSLHVKPPERK